MIDAEVVEEEMRQRKEAMNKVSTTSGILDKMWIIAKYFHCLKSRTSVIYFVIYFNRM